MKRFATLLTSATCTLAFCAAAQASAPNKSTTPNGNGAVKQYLESVPTDQGNSPTSSLRGHGTHHSGGAGGVTGGGGGGTGGTGSTGTGTPSSGSNTGGASNLVAASTRRSLDKHGAAGKAAAALAVNTAPVVSQGQGDTGSQSQSPSPSGSSALGSLVSAVTGSASNGGLGLLLPVILVVVLFGTTAFAVLRRRRQT
jgi:hypothetical protein